MESAITSKGQATIPKAIREHLGLKPGDRIKFFLHPDGSVVLLPELPASALRGMLAGRRPGRSAGSRKGPADVQIRPFVERDWPQVWPILRAIVQAADTFAYDPAMSEAQAHATWIEAPPGLTVVATQGDRILGTAKMGPNRAGPGAHVATASFMVAPAARGRGVGAALCRFTLAWAREQGFAGMQFNAVAETNHAAVDLYQGLGFTIIGTVPGAFAHPIHGRVGLHVMYCVLRS